MRILLIEDDPSAGPALARALLGAGHVVDLSPDGRAGLERAETGTYDAVLLDLGLPDIFGMDVLATLRARGIEAPVIVITARDAVADRVRGLDVGADDYLVKPFATEEALARIRALLRRRGPPRTAVLSSGDLTLDPARRTVTRGGAALELTRREFALLDYFLRNAGIVLTRAMIAENVWSDRQGTLSNVIDVHVRNLRRKTEALGPPLIQTVRGAGYVLRAPS